jgi:hypothetical protein
VKRHPELQKRCRRRFGSNFAPQTSADDFGVGSTIPCFFTVAPEECVAVVIVASIDAVESFQALAGRIQTAVRDNRERP